MVGQYLKKMKALFRGMYYWGLEQLPSDVAVPINFVRRQGYIPNLSRPKTFSELLIRRKLRDDPYIYAMWSDKINAKHIVASRLGQSLILESLYEGDYPSREEYCKLEPPFVLKASNASGANVFIYSESDKDYERNKLEVDSKRKAFFKRTDESFYSLCPNRYIIEPLMLNDSGQVPNDYKLHVFHGKVVAIQVDVGRFSEHKRNLYNVDWKLLPYSLRFKNSELILNKPKTLNVMISAAKSIGANFPYIRVDFYEYNDTAVFGEVTFIHGNGYSKFSSIERDKEWGSYWRRVESEG